MGRQINQRPPFRAGWRLYEVITDLWIICFRPEAVTRSLFGAIVSN